MRKVEPSIFKKYDIRGKASGEDAIITTEIAHLVGQAFGTYLQRLEEKELIVIGRDNRRSSFELQQAAIEGLRLTGCHVIDLGLVSTPVMYWHTLQHGNVGGIMVTGSHLPPEQNGFKLCIGNRNLYGEKIQALRSFIENDLSAYGGGELMVDERSYSKYIHDLEKRVKMTRKLKVVLDPGNGTAGLFAPRLMQLWGHETTCIFCEPDGDYPHHQPDPQYPANLQALGEKVREVKADVGIAFDGDADRMGAVDEQGEFIPADRLLALLARDLLGRHPGATVIADVLSSQVLFDEVEKAGGKAVMTASGHSIVKEKMDEEKALLGGEMSGHIFLGEDYFGFDDGYLAAGRLLQMLSGKDQTLSQLNQSIPSLYSTPEYRPYCPYENTQTIIDHVKAELSSRGEVITVDGVRVKFERGWGLLRASNTEPVLSLRFEAETEADALTYRDWFIDALKAFPKIAPITG
jgi:phosphomannomutase / phosphoglucomutase